MENEELIAMEVYCDHEGVEVSFVEALHDRGLIRITTVKEQRFIDPEHLSRVEKLARMHYDLDINLEGIEAISHLLERMEALQQDMRSLSERLRLYE
ncbi:MAG: chaperone modulator CbpM [Flavobacteriales bacterium]|nr:chaperone modulator CbpM [Flavobacteriales bacterium]MBK9763049.1 chaperone modulator CbpM [Flavobacteriales bacterium]